MIKKGNFQLIIVSLVCYSGSPSLFTESGDLKLWENNLNWKLVISCRISMIQTNNHQVPTGKKVSQLIINHSPTTPHLWSHWKRWQQIKESKYSQAHLSNSQSKYLLYRVENTVLRTKTRNGQDLHQVHQWHPPKLLIITGDSANTTLLVTDRCVFRNMLV